MARDPHTGHDRGPSRWIEALSSSHRSLANLVATLDDGALRHRSYCDDWNVAQVLSHLGSGAEIFRMVLDAALTGGETPSRDTLPAVWERWNSKSPEQQAGDFVDADRQLIGAVEDAADRLADLDLTLFGMMTVDGVGFLGMRLNEHALHAWDVAVAFDPTARIGPAVADLLVGRLPAAGHAGHAEGAGGSRPFSVLMATTDSDRSFAIAVDDEVQITEVTEANAPRDLHLPAESVLRLVYGRLDDHHRPPIDAGELPVLDRLRRVFTGF